MLSWRLAVYREEIAFGKQGRREGTPCADLVSLDTTLLARIRKRSIAL